MDGTTPPASDFSFLQINPILFEIGGVRIYYYGLMYAIGFLGMHLWVLARRRELGWTRNDAFDFSLVFIVSVLVLGRAFDLIVYEWTYYREHVGQIPFYWRGGMATHGVLLGAVIGALVFCWIRGKSFLRVTDEIAIPGALFMALGRIGNHINGEVYGYATDVSWAMRFPYADGPRHPVALYDGLKNLLLIPILAFVRLRSVAGQGLVTAHFIFWYGFLRLIVDHFRDYDSYWFGIGRGQYFNLAMAIIGLVFIDLARERKGRVRRMSDTSYYAAREWRPRRRQTLFYIKAAIFYALVIICLTIPSGWTQEVLETLRTRLPIPPA